MIKGMFANVGRYKSLLGVVLAVFFSCFIFLLHIEDVMPQAEYHKANINESQTTTEDTHANNMSSQGMDNELFFGSVLVNEIFFNTNQQVFHGFYRTRSNAPLLRFVIFWFVLFATAILSRGYLYINRRENFGCNRCFLKRILNYIHKSDGKKGACLYGMI